MVELASNTAEALAADDAPTITLPLTVALEKVPVIFEAATSVTFAFVIAPSAIEAVATAPVAIFEVVIAPGVMINSPVGERTASAEIDTAVGRFDVLPKIIAPEARFSSLARVTLELAILAVVTALSPLYR